MSSVKREEEALELDTRRAIYQYIRSCPGAHLRGVHRAVGLPFGQVLYHLNYMEKNDLIIVKKDGKFNRYFVKNNQLVGRKEKDIIAVLRHEIPRRVVIVLLFRPRLAHKEILEYMDVSASTLSFHLNKMVELGVIQREPHGRESFYWVTDERTTAKVLIMHRESFQSDVVDRFANVWLSVNFRDAETRAQAAKEDEVLSRYAGAPENLAEAVLGAHRPKPAEAAATPADGASPSPAA